MTDPLEGIPVCTTWRCQDINTEGLSLSVQDSKSKPNHVLDDIQSAEIVRFCSGSKIAIRSQSTVSISSP